MPLCGPLVPDGLADGNGATPGRQLERPARVGFTTGFMQKFGGGANKFAPEIQLSSR